MHWIEHQWPIEKQRQQRHPCGGHVHGDDVTHGLLDVVEDAPPELYCFHHGSEIILEQHQRCGLARHFRSALAHGDSDMSRLQGGRVIDAISRHRDDLAVGLERLHQPQLLLGDHASEDVGLHNPLAQLRIGHGVKLGPGHDRFGIREADLARDGLRGAGIVTGDHHGAYPRGVAFPYGRRHGGPNGIGKSGESDEMQPQLALRRRPRIFVLVGPR